MSRRDSRKELLERLIVARLFLREGEQLAEERPGPADLPVHPRQHLGAARLVLRQEAPRPVREVFEDGSGFEDDDQLAFRPLGVEPARGSSRWG
jgi:hypothetical protein